MSQLDHFIFTPSVWEGKGKIRFNLSPEKLSFFTKWEIVQNNDKSISCIQTIDILDVPDKMENSFHFTNIHNKKFLVSLSNEILGNVKGTGLFDKEIIAWEFKGNDLDFEGFEVFEKQENNHYLTKAEFTSKDQVRTFIEGSIWLTQNSDTLQS